MAKEEMKTRPLENGGKLMIAALLIALAILGGSYLLSQGDYAPKVNVVGGDAYPNVYVSSTPPEHGISVSATATTETEPDLLLIQVRVETESDTAKQSVSDNAALVAELTPNLEDLGLEKEDIKTSSYSVNPVYTSDYVCDTSGNRCRYVSNVTGYKTTHVLTVTVTDLTIGGDVIDEASSVGENETFIDSVYFTLQESTRKSIEKSLLANASEEAELKAEEIADGFGESLGRLLTASESSSFNYPTLVNYRAVSAAEAAPSTSLSGGQISVSATVIASFEIE